MRFRKGEKVVCVAAVAGYLAVGRKYSVEACYEAGRDMFVALKELGGYWYASRFDRAVDTVQVGTFPFLNPGPGRV